MPISSATSLNFVTTGAQDPNYRPRRQDEAHGRREHQEVLPDFESERIHGVQKWGMVEVRSQG